MPILTYAGYELSRQHSERQGRISKWVVGVYHSSRLTITGYAFFFLFQLRQNPGRQQATREVGPFLVLPLAVREDR